MKRLTTILAVLAVCAMAASAFAQPAANPQAEHQWQHFLSNHPGLAEHPQWLNNPTYMKDHPNLAKWLHDHPRVLADARHQGMWDRNNGEWHDSDWWRDHNPNSMYQHHPEWAENHPNWRGPNDGAYDQNHHWQNRGWWEKNHPEWAKQHHPNWYQYQQNHDHD